MKDDDDRKKRNDELQSLVDDIEPSEEGEVRARFDWALATAKLRGVAEELIDQVKLLWEMLTDSSHAMKWETKAAVIAGLTYFISPIDAIPDPIPGAGYLDDAVVIAWVLHNIGDEVARYRKTKRAA